MCEKRLNITGQHRSWLLTPIPPAGGGGGLLRDQSFLWSFLPGPSERASTYLTWGVGRGCPYLSDLGKGSPLLTCPGRGWALTVPVHHWPGTLHVNRQKDNTTENITFPGTKNVGDVDTHSEKKLASLLHEGERERRMTCKKWE